MKKILFFDDEPFISKYLVQSLNEHFGWEDISFISTTDELINEVTNENVTYDLFVLDVMAPMPSDNLTNIFTQVELNKMDEGRSVGVVMAEKIRENKKYLNVPIVFLTARIIHIPDTIRGKSDYLRKPISPEELSNKMEKLLNPK